MISYDFAGHVTDYTTFIRFLCECDSDWPWRAVSEEGALSLGSAPLRYEYSKVVRDAGYLFLRDVIAVAPDYGMFTIKKKLSYATEMNHQGNEYHWLHAWRCCHYWGFDPEWIFEDRYTELYHKFKRKV